ncbi:undecaprenyl-phosphate 4-deoxy-4-formamido-L-arabinose transferase [Arcicella aurantiaca]|uniref:Undecaprenyl-phosphate 4-deoxy-4-formamido-L-arabinose transferase n=1 Tax=Arcicella aurantiaca TaxID=591202 RepID=A0A316EBT4_9BACT|nr:glycosyltransferase family 2 protein [Arcicella aurantiaca]PWK28307.1 undecaprenyl-phosphate 4-deoxy-4-formamido-L-arabinose transferase [Arcicella aurantiaca]
MLLSVVIPVYHGAVTITKLVETVQEQLKAYAFEIILINDGSKDNSEQVCINLSEQYKNISFLSLRKNFGEFNAVMCGLYYAKGEYTVIIDDDFQNPPSEIIKLLNTAQNGNFDVVYSQYDEKKHHAIRNFGSWLVNQVTTTLFKKPQDLYLSSFKIIKREVVEEICKYKGPYPYLDGLIFNITDNVGKVTVIHNDRHHGESNYTAKKLASLFLNIIFGYSLLPVRLSLFLGMLSTFTALILSVLQLFSVIDYPIRLVVLFFGGIQLISIGIVGEYIGKTFLTQGNTPQYTLKIKRINNAE